jgi:HEAT repeat protein
VADQAEIHRMARSENAIERREAVEQLRENFAHLPDKKQAWEDLHRLTSDIYSGVRRGAAYALDGAFVHRQRSSMHSLTARLK